MTFFKNRKTPFILFGALIFLILVIAALSLATEPFIKKQIENLVHKSQGDAWQVTVEKANASIIPLSIRLEEIRIAALPNDDSVSEATKVSIGSMEISGFSMWDYWFNDQLAFRSIFVGDINGTIGGFPEANGTHDRSKKSLQRLEVGRFEVSSIALSYFKGEQESQIRDGSLVAEGLSFRMIDQSLTIDGLVAELYGVEQVSKDNLHRFGAGSVLLNKDRSSLVVDSMFIEPLKSIDAFGALDIEKSRISLSLPELAVQFDYNAFIKHQRISIASAVFTKPSLEVFRDKSPPDNPVPVDLPSETIQKIKIPLQIDSMSIVQGSIVYHEKPDKSPDYGHVYFHDLNATLNNITNVSDSAAIAKASAYLMGAGRLNVEIFYPSGIRQDTFIIDGALETMSLEHINPMIVNAAFARVDNGAVNSLGFRFHGNSRYAAGRMDFTYSDMKVTLLRLDKNGDHLERKTRSLFANMIVSDSNPKKGNFRVGEIRFERDEKKSIFNYWWKSLFSGIKSSVGLKEKKNE